MSRKIKKIIPYIFALLLLVGLFSPMVRVHAETPAPAVAPAPAATDPAAQALEKALPNTAIVNLAATGETIERKEQTPFEKVIVGSACLSISEGTVSGCVKQLFYYVVYIPSSAILYVAAIFFDALIAVSLNSSTLSGSAFIPEAWAVVRDLSNIFFILILLYIAIKIILDIGASEAKKMISKVIIIALLINFSMFFTQVVIDSSNMLALVFYNKLDVTYKDPKTGAPTKRPGNPSTPGEKGLSAAMYSNFDPTSKINLDFWNKVKDKDGDVPVGTMIAIICIAAGIMLFAAYAFFISGIAFLARIIELWVLIIFSPFALMSSTTPILSGTDYIGWDAWFKRLFKVAFMAPIFMFFMYLIFLILKTPDLFSKLGTSETQNWGQTLLFVLIPGILICVLLQRATEYAKKASGEIGTKLFAGAKMVGGLALGAATGGAAMALSGGLGGLSSRIASGKRLNETAKKDTLGGMAARMALGTAKYGSKASFDVRGVPGVGTLTKMGGLDIGKAKEGGYQQRRKEQVEKRQKRAKELEVGEDEPLKQALNKTEMDLQGLLSKNTQDIEGLDKLIEKKRQEVSDANSNYNAVKDTKGPGETVAQALARTAAQTALNTANTQLNQAKTNKTNLRTGLAYTNHNGVAKGAIVGAGGSIDALEKQQKNDAQAIKTENVERRQAYAKRIVKWGGNGIRTDREAAHKIIMETKLDSGTKA